MRNLDLLFARTLATCSLLVTSFGFAQTLVMNTDRYPQTLFPANDYVNDGNGEVSWSKSIGDSTLGAELEVVCGWWCSENKRGIYGDLAGNVFLFGREYEAAGVHAQSYNDYENGSSELEVVLANSTVLTKTWSCDKEYSWSLADEISKSSTFMVGPVPVTVSVAAGFSVEVDLDFNTSLTGVGLDGFAFGSAYGSASAGVGASLEIWGYEVAEISLKVVATVDFFSLTVNFDAMVTATGVSGEVTLTLEALTLRLEIVATFQILWWDYSYSIEIIDLTYASVSKTLFAF